MDKTYIDDTNMWYNEGVHRAVCSLAKKYDNAIPVFGGALGAYDYVNCNNPDFKKFINRLRNVAYDAKFYKWHEGPVGAVRRFCRMCLVDPALIETYINMSIEQFCAKCCQE